MQVHTLKYRREGGERRSIHRVNDYNQPEENRREHLIYEYEVGFVSYSISGQF